MIHDPELTDRLSGYKQEGFDGEVFRATGLSADPTVSSTIGGRWAPPAENGGGVAVLYTSMSKDGAIAEVAAYLAEQVPIPSKPIRVHRLSITTSRTVRLDHSDLLNLGVDPTRYGERNYSPTQRIGAALNFLGVDGLIAPSARWACDNLMVFTENHALAERVSKIDSEEIDWRAWAARHGRS